MNDADDFSIYRFQKKYFPSFVELIHDNFEIKNKDKEKYIFWKYFDLFYRGKTITYLAVNDSGKVISQYTNVPISISYQGKSFRTTVCMDMVTDSVYRGRGIITLLSKKVYKEVENEKYDFSFGFSNDEGVVVDKKSKGYGYKVVGKFAVYFKIVIRKKKIPLRLLGVRDFKTVLEDDGRFIQIEKTKEYLRWKYIKRPGQKYLFYRLDENGDDHGFVVLKSSSKKMYVYDIITQDKSSKRVKQILRAIENEACKQKKRIVIVKALENGYWKKIFLKTGFLKKMRNKKNYYLTVKFHNHLLDEKVILNKDYWWALMGDIV